MATTLAGATFQDDSGEIRFRGSITTTSASGGFTTDTLAVTTTATVGTSLSTPAVSALVANTGIKVAATGDKLGFYGTAPVSQQTGVAVSAAGIHAACVALGLFTA